MPTLKQIPAAALRMTAGICEFGDNGPAAKTVPIKMLARTGQPIDHWYWGRVVHDMAGMTMHKDRLPVDYVHDSAEVLGYLNHFDTTSGDLVVSGALTPFSQSDRCSEIIHKAKQGVPYEASINFGGNGIRCEEVAEGKTAQVNGYEFAGPGIIIRQWPLRGVAVCPYGADQNTNSQFAQAGEPTVPVLFDSQEITPMSTTTAEAARTAAVDATQTNLSAEAGHEIKPAVEAAPSTLTAGTAGAEAPKPAVEATQPSPGQKFLDAFGDKGGVWFAQGKSLDEAQALYVADLKTQLAAKDAEIADLKNRLAAIPRGDKPVAFSPEHTPAQEKATALTHKLGPNLARVAAGINLPGEEQKE